MYESIQWHTWKALCSTILILLSVGALGNLRPLWAGVTFHIPSGSEQPEQEPLETMGKAPANPTDTSLAPDSVTLPEGAAAYLGATDNKHHWRESTGDRFVTAIKKNS